MNIDTTVVEILHDLLTHCVAYDGHINALDKCAKEKMFYLNDMLIGIKNTVKWVYNIVVLMLI